MEAPPVHWYRKGGCSEEAPPSAAPSQGEVCQVPPHCKQGKARMASKLVGLGRRQGQIYFGLVSRYPRHHVPSLPRHPRCTHVEQESEASSSYSSYGSQLYPKYPQLSEQRCTQVKVQVPKQCHVGSPCPFVSTSVRVTVHDFIWHCPC